MGLVPREPDAGSFTALKSRGKLFWADVETENIVIQCDKAFNEMHPPGTIMSGKNLIPRTVKFIERRIKHLNPHLSIIKLFVNVKVDCNYSYIKNISVLRLESSREISFDLLGLKGNSRRSLTFGF